VRTIFFCGLLCLLNSAMLSAQSAKIQALEEQLRPAFGPGRASLYIALADACIEEGLFDKAADWADEGAEFAKKIRQPDLRATALNRHGKALLLGGKRRAAGKFEQSLEVLQERGSGDKALMLDNLQSLRLIAEKAGRTKDIPLIDERIAVLRGLKAPSAALAGPPTPPGPADGPVTKQELQKEITKLQQELSGGKSALKLDQARMVEQSRLLESKLAEKEAEIEKMNEAQMKSAMMLMQQRFLLDSVVYRAGIDSLSVANTQLELKEARSNQKFFFAAALAFLFLAGGASFSFLRARENSRVLGEKNNIIREEQRRSENLLLNILPALVADELKRQGHTNARYFEDVSVLFADFVGFSKIAEQLSPQQLVSDLDTCFRAFDQIIAKYGIEKIKTIGDAYMCAGGLPDGGGAQLRDIVAAARDMQRWLTDWNIERHQQGLPRFDARIGIHSGPVVAGVVGSKKFAFVIWGDTVNIAARIEQAGEGGKINVSGEVFEIIKQYYPCHYRGKIPAKNKGEIDMYFVEH
jgi:class 3 adenylate cyclase